MLQDKVFTVKIPKTDTVSILEEEVKHRLHSEKYRPYGKSTAEASLSKVGSQIDGEMSGSQASVLSSF